MTIEVGSRVEIFSSSSVNFGKRGTVEIANLGKCLVNIDGGGYDTVRWFNTKSLIEVRDETPQDKKETEQWYLVVDGAAMEEQVMSKDDVEGYVNNAVVDQGYDALEDIKVYKLFSDINPVNFKTEVSIED